MNKEAILKKIKEHYGFRSDAEFARFLDITPQNLKQWYTRNTFDISILATKCKDISTEWLITGSGQMHKPGVEHDTTSTKGQGIPVGRLNLASMEIVREMMKMTSDLIANNKEAIATAKINAIATDKAINESVRERRLLEELVAMLKEERGYSSQKREHSTADTIF